MTQEALKLALDYLESRGLAWNVQIALREALREHAMREVQRLGQEIEQEPVAQPASEEDMKIYKTIAANYHKDLSTPPQRTWVGLTDDEISEVLGSDIHDEPSGELRFIRAIEAKLKDKNNAA